MGTPDTKTIHMKTAAEQTYALIHDALDAYAEHWSSLGEKADQAGASVTDVQGNNDYDFMETVKAIAWSYFLYEIVHNFQPFLRQNVSKDIVSTLKRKDKTNQRRMGRFTWDETAVKGGQPLKQYLQTIECGSTLEGFLLDHFQAGKILLNGLLKPLAQYKRGVLRRNMKRSLKEK